MLVSEYNSHFFSTNRREKLITDSNSAQKSKFRCINSEKGERHRSIENKNESLVKVILGWATRLFCVFEIFFPKCE